MLLRQLSYAKKNQLKAPKAPYQEHFLPLAVSLWHKDRVFYAGKESLIGDQFQQSLAMTEQGENSTWEGPGHGSVVQVEWGTPAGQRPQLYFVFTA